MKLDKDSRKLSKQLFQASFTDGKLDEGKVRIIAKKIADSKPRNFVGILKDFQRQVRLDVEKHHAVIESAQPLDDAMSKQVVDGLKAKYGPSISSEFKVTPDLIGGLRIKIGSDVFDSSVRSRLDRLETNLLHA
ncbi:MAG: F0F1-type synthase delta subunit-like protein [Chthoniobacter sp.]|jgi:F-type H+-transporting ATPase subunit delta|nr:F0F1-type synthase delta subunit-like protein [Chthoniobacter sp.]